MTTTPTGTYDADLRPALRLLHRQQVRGARRDLAAAMHRLIEARTENPLADLDTVSAGQVVTTARGVRARDWIDDAMDRSVRYFAYPLDTPSKRRLTASALRATTKETTR